MRENPAVPRTPTTSPPRRAAAPVAALLVAALLALGGCGEREDTEPGIPTMDTTPHAVLVVDDDGLRWVAGDATIDDLTLDPVQLPSGTLLLVRNDGEDPHRLRAGKRFDTGVLEPGETTLVLFDEEPTEPKDLTVIDVDDPDRTTSFVVLPAEPG